MIDKKEAETRFNTEFQKEISKFKFTKIFILLWIIITTIAIVALTVLYNLLLDNSGEHALLSAIICILAWMGLSLLPVLAIKDKQIAKFKKLNLQRTLTIFYGSNVEYLKNGVIDQNLFKIYCNQKFDTYSGEDYFSVDISRETPKGIIKTKLMVSDVVAKKLRQKENGGTEQTVVFKAAVGVIKFSKPFACKLILNPQKWQTELQEMETESTDFNKIFKPKTNDQISARQILSVTLMQYLIDFARSAKQKVHLAFLDEYLFIVLDKNILETSKKDDNLNFKLIEPIYNDLELFDKIAKEIQQNYKIFKI